MKTVIGDCPLGKECEKPATVSGETVIVRCPWYKRLIGKDPQTGNPIDTWDCAVGWVPILLTELSLEMRQTAAAVESTRNELVTRQDKALSVFEEVSKTVCAIERTSVAVAMLQTGVLNGVEATDVGRTPKHIGSG